MEDPYMAKRRSSRSRRRDPVRRTIPPSRLATAPPIAMDADLNDQNLVGGWPLDGDVRIRLARREDLPAVRALSTLAGVDLDVEVVEAVDAGVAGAALRAGLSGGQGGFVDHLAQQIFANQAGNQARTLQHAALVLVAEHGRHGIVGALVAFPPVRLIESLLDHLRRIGVAGPQRAQLLYCAVMWMARIKAIAVTDGLRGTGIGGALLLRCWQIYERSGYMIVFGQSDDTPPLAKFFSRHGFQVLGANTGFDPWVVLGVHVDVRPDIGQRTFIWQRHRNRRITAPVPRRQAGDSISPNRSKQADHDAEQTPRRPADKPVPLLNAGTLPLVMGAAEKLSLAPLNLLTAAAVQAAQRASHEGRARLHLQVIAALRLLGFEGRVMAAQAIAWREDEPHRSVVTVGADIDSRRASLTARRHTVVWAESFSALLDVMVCFDSHVRELAADGLQELLALPAMLVVPSLEPFVTSGAVPTVQRGPIRIGWNLSLAAGDDGTREFAPDDLQRGGEVLADATLDLLLAAADYVDLEPMHAGFPHLRAMMARRESTLWAPAGAR